MHDFLVTSEGGSWEEANNSTLCISCDWSGKNTCKIICSQGHNASTWLKRWHADDKAQEKHICRRQAWRSFLNSQTQISSFYLVLGAVSVSMASLSSQQASQTRNCSWQLNPFLSGWQLMGTFSPSVLHCKYSLLYSFQLCNTFMNNYTKKRAKGGDMVGPWQQACEQSLSVLCYTT